MRRPIAYADCTRCGAPAHPTTGYCSRFCWECDVYDREHHGPKAPFRIENLDPPSAEAWEAFLTHEPVTTISNGDGAPWATATVEELIEDLERIGRCLRPISIAYGGLR